MSVLVHIKDSPAGWVMAGPLLDVYSLFPLSHLGLGFAVPTKAGYCRRMKTEDQASWVAWPAAGQIRYALVRVSWVALCFALVYGGAEWLTVHRVTRVKIAMEWEQQMPFVPAFSLIYISAYAVLFPLALWVLRTRREIDELAFQLVIIILLAGLGFLLLPANLAYAPPGELGLWRPLFIFADDLNLDHNLAPSLHVALSTVCLEHYALRVDSRGKWALRAWGGLIAASTLLLHQHHVLDVVAGYALALGVWSYRQRTQHLRS